MEVTASIIVLNYNGRHYLERCLASLQRQTFQGFELIVVDNGSTDGSRELLEGLDFLALRLIANPENLDFARGNNQGIAQAQGRYLVTLNNDTEADERWLEEVGLFDEEFVSCCEDTDLGLRGWLRGWRCLYAPAAVVYHVYSGTMGAYSERKAYLVERNRLWTAFKILPWPLLLLSPAYTLWRYFYQSYGALAGWGSSGRLAEQLPRAQLLRILLRAYWDGLRALPRLLPRRQLIQRGRKLSTWDLYRLLRRHRISAREIAWQE